MIRFWLIPVIFLSDSTLDKLIVLLSGDLEQTTGLSADLAGSLLVVKKFSLLPYFKEVDMFFH